ncbi:hypothetical protein D3C77_702580 [compost metagenome]
MVVTFALKHAAQNDRSEADRECRDQLEAATETLHCYKRSEDLLTEQQATLRELLTQARASVDYQRGMQNTNHPAGQAHAAAFKQLLEQIDTALAVQPAAGQPSE